MEGLNIIERAFQLASACGSIDEVRQELKREGYLQVDAHLSGRQIRSQLMERLSPERLRPQSGEEAEEAE